ncbi:MAG TPA: hypothetical protein VEK34_04545 [Methylocella sp.]|nr:hypothetical protein [Methylocella sp.]
MGTEQIWANFSVREDRDMPLEWVKAQSISAVWSKGLPTPKKSATGWTLTVEGADEFGSAHQSQIESRRRSSEQRSSPVNLTVAYWFVVSYPAFSMSAANKVQSFLV